MHAQVQSAVGNPYTMLKKRYERLLRAALAVQSAVDEVAQLLERLHATVSWEDPHATMMFAIFCFVAAVFVAAVPWAVIQSFALCFMVSSASPVGLISVCHHSTTACTA